MDHKSVRGMGEVVALACVHPPPPPMFWPGVGGGGIVHRLLQPLPLCGP